MVLAQYSDTDYGIRLIYIFDAAINFYYFIEILQGADIDKVEVFIF